MSILFCEQINKYTVCDRQPDKDIMLDIDIIFNIQSHQNSISTQFIYLFVCWLTKTDLKISFNMFSLHPTWRLKMTSLLSLLVARLEQVTYGALSIPAIPEDSVPEVFFLLVFLVQNEWEFMCPSHPTASIQYIENTHTHTLGVKLKKNSLCSNVDVYVYVILQSLSSKVRIVCLDVLVGLFVCVISEFQIVCVFVRVLLWIYKKWWCLNHVAPNHLAGFLIIWLVSETQQMDNHLTCLLANSPISRSGRPVWSGPLWWVWRFADGDDSHSKWACSW